ncbi:Endochitinase B1 [Neonectria ditissima]|uniref:chitinase n=1 Tax=Neonectria ditissima TaxID=78410 RepID=A0A0P7BJS2_9HYPO|nr:Endochitinase B1 [Neonectria ditissima]
MAPTMLRLLFVIAPLLAQSVLAVPRHRHEIRFVTSTVTAVSVATVVHHLAAPTSLESSVDPVVLPRDSALDKGTTDLIDTDWADSVPIETRALQRRNVLYFTNWGVYGADYQPQQIPADKVTHLLYSFLDIASDGTVKSSDTWSDIDKHYSTDSWSDSGNNAYGCVKQLFLLKKQNRRFKTMLSIGGWTYSSKFAPVAATSATRKQFASSAVKLLADWGFDGIDIDWEYPVDSVEANNYVLLLKEIRTALDAYSTASSLNYRFIITIATSAGPAHYNTMNLAGMDPYVDAWHLMAYDYAGSWDTLSGLQANVYKSTAVPKATPFNTDQAVADYIAKGIAPSKIVLGMPLYGRSFTNTAGLGKPFSGVGGDNGIYLYRDLPRPNTRTKVSTQAISVFSYDETKKELVTYENIATAKLKANYIKTKGLGGAVYWEASGDKTGSDSIVRTVAGNLGGLDMSLNMLSYPKSVYDNIRAGMP